MCNSTHGSLCWSLIEVCGYNYIFFFQNLNCTVNHPKWPLDDCWPHMCWGNVCNSVHESLCPYNSHGNTQKYVNRMTIFKNFNPRVNASKWPQDGHKIRSAVGSSRVCISPFSSIQYNYVLLYATLFLLPQKLKVWEVVSWFSTQISKQIKLAKNVQK